CRPIISHSGNSTVSVRILFTYYQARRVVAEAFIIPGPLVIGLGKITILNFLFFNQIHKRMKQKLLCFFMLGILLIGSAYAQDRRISGRVTAAADGAPISGVSVLAVGTNVADQTDDLGTFSIDVPQNVTTLEFRSLGYASQKVTLGSQNNIEVILQTDATAIDEVVVIAYGTAKRSSFTGSAATVSAEIIENRPITNISKALDGAVPGVQSTLGSGQPGSSAGIRVRGFGSINASADPLYVVDGVPFNGDLNAINPNDVETVTVVKIGRASSRERR